MDPLLPHRGKEKFTTHTMAALTDGHFMLSMKSLCAASATEVLLECGCEGEAQCLDSGVPRSRQVRPDPHSEPDLAHGRSRPRKLLRLVTKQQPLVSNPGGPPTPDLQAPHFASQDSSDSADSNVQR